MPEGGILGYHCCHEYPITIKTPKILPECLKGQDAAFMSAAQILRLQADLFVEWRQQSWNNENTYRDEYYSMGDASSSYYSVENEPPHDYHRDTYWMYDGKSVFGKSHIEGCSDLGMRSLEKNGFPCKDPDAIQWINEASKDVRFEATTSIQYGNDPEDESFYSTACILVVIKPSIERAIVGV